MLWKGFPASAGTWEPMAGMNDATVAEDIEPLLARLQEAGVAGAEGAEGGGSAAPADHPDSRIEPSRVGKGALKVVLSGIVVPVESPVLNSRTRLCYLLSRSADESRKY